MQLYPPATVEEARAWLTARAAETWGEDVTEGLADDIEAMAKALARIAAIELDDELEPLFP